MVSKITLFELHADDVQFGPASVLTGNGSDGVPTETDDAGDSSGSKSPLATVLQDGVVFAVLVGVLWLVFSRLRSEDDE